MTRGDFRIFLLLVGASLALNLVGIDWGLPSRERSAYCGLDAGYFETPQWDRMIVTAPYDSFNPDEGALMNALSEMHPGKGDFNPHFFNYPSLWTYAAGAALFASAKAGLVALVPSKAYYIEHPEAMARMFLIGRILTAAFSALGAALLFLTVRALFGSTVVSICSALALLASPLWVRNSHFVLVNVPATVWMILSAFLAVWAVRTRRMLLVLALSGLAAGLAASTKYNAGAVLVLPVFILFRTASHPGRKLPPAAVLLVASAAAAGFLAGTPYAVVSVRKFVGDLLFEVGDKVGPPPLWTLFANLVVCQGTVLTALGIAGMAVVAVRVKDWRHQFVGLWLLAGLTTGLISNTDVMRYLIPALPPLAVCAGLAAYHGHLGVLSRLGGSSRGRLLAVLPLLLLLAPLAYSLDTDRILARRPDARIEAARWIVSEIPKGTEIGLVGRIWFDTPPINAMDYRLTDLKQALDARPGLVVVTPEGRAWYRSWPGDGNYELAKVFRRQPAAFHAFPIRRRPRDWTYTFPEIFIYRRAG